MVLLKDKLLIGYNPACRAGFKTVNKNLPTEDRSALLIVYCRCGIRSGIAKRKLKALGFENVINFGAITGWEGEVVIREEN